MDKLTIIIAQQEYINSNHKFLWHELSKNQSGDILILDIPADYLVTKIKRKKYRIEDYKKGLYKIDDNLYKYRPLYKIRPEIVPESILPFIGKSLRNQLMKFYDLTTKEINFIIYDSIWAKILTGFGSEHKIYYYIYDEYLLHAHNDKKNNKKVKYDKLACENARHIFSMTETIKKRREEYAYKITVIGNGANLPLKPNIYTNIKNSIAFVGTFRDWIDKELLENLIKARQDLNFCFVGPIEKNMSDYFNNIMNNYRNTMYFGVLKKEIANEIYSSFNIVMVPYMQNEFMQSTRPIKIVESIFSATPVITIPMDGYKESKFIKFARDAKEFSNLIDYLLINGIDTEDIEYAKFINENSWESKAQIINKVIGN